MKIFDGHSDILLDVTRKKLAGEKDVFKRYHYNALKGGNIAGIIMVIWTNVNCVDTTEDMLQNLGAMSEELYDIKDISGIVYKYEDMQKILENNRIPIILGIEGLSGLKGNISIVDMLYRIGLRHASVTWNEENEFGTGMGSENSDRGLTKKGVELIDRMEALGMIVDVSHSNEKTFWDIYENSRRPFIASHSNAYELCNSGRNLKDDQIKAIADRGGVIGINGWRFVDNSNSTIERFVDHIDYIERLVGFDHVGLGFDFCGFLDKDMPEVVGLEDVSRTHDLVRILERRGYNPSQIEKITYENFNRIIKEIL
jgi:membrane dipeptidase